jgi:purine-binding chemotaxis protein CheW
MNTDRARVTTADELRRTFDRAFAEPPTLDAEPEHDLLAITVGGDRFAIPVLDAAGLFVDKAVTRLPGSLEAVRGLAALRGAMVPVYDLCVLLGYPKMAASRWLLVAARAPVALAFDRFDGHVRVSQRAITRGPEQRGAARVPHVISVVQSDAFAGTVVDVPSVLEAITVLVGRATGRRSTE